LLRARGEPIPGVEERHQLLAHSERLRRRNSESRTTGGVAEPPTSQPSVVIRPSIEAAGAFRAQVFVVRSNEHPPIQPAREHGDDVGA